uniref:Defensin n=1 Tax=Bursaphelenchus xylophilus TaxID=6326 RepID=A0A1I7SBM3_BURXY
MRATIIFSIFLVLILAVSANPTSQPVKGGGLQLPSGDNCDPLRCNRACQDHDYRGGSCSMGRCICF